MALLVSWFFLFSITACDNTVTGSYDLGSADSTPAIDDTTPAAFAFTDVTAQAVSTQIESNIIQITGISTGTNISISGDASREYRVCPDAICTTETQTWGSTAGTGVVTNNSYVQVRLTSSAANSTASTVTLTIGGVSDTWSATTIDDTTPAAFAFTDVTAQAVSTQIASNIIQITGISTGTNISISGDASREYRVCPDATCTTETQTWGSAAGTGVVTNNSYVQVRLTSSASYATTSTVTLTIGGVSDTWSAKTRTQPAWTQLTNGTQHTCGLASDGKAYCWGDDVAGQLGEDADGDNLDENIPVLVDTSALTAGSSFVSLMASSYHTCGLASDGKAYCWGYDNKGQLGENADGDNLAENIPVLVDTSALTAGSQFVGFSAGYEHTCGLASDGKAYCWGRDDFGQLGENADGDNLDENIPVLVNTSALTAGSSFVSLTAANLHTCGLASDGKAYCWGQDGGGQLGENADGDNANENIPVLVDTSALTAGSHFVSLTAGQSHTCGLASDGKAYCWGGDTFGQLGENADGDNLAENIPVLVDTSALTAGSSFVSLTAGDLHTCGLASDGKAYCWGYDGYGELGENADSDNANENIPVLVDTSALTAGASFVSLEAEGYHTCGLTSDGKAYCWGYDADGQLGENADADNADENIPVLVDTSAHAAKSVADFVEIVAGQAHTCGLASDGKAYCWGSDGDGQLGENADGDNADEDIPVLVDTSALTAGSSLVSLTAGAGHTCGLASDGKAYCWGYDGYGELGENADGDNADENIPVLVDTSALTVGSNFVSLTAGSYHTCGLASDGKAYCWGDDDFGQLGENADADNADENIPVLVDTSALTAGSRFVSLTAGNQHTCGLGSDGKAYCWGRDNYGQLGENADADNADENIPVLVDTTALTAGSLFVRLTAGGVGGARTCGLASDGKAYCWGRDNYGQLGENADGDNLAENIPVLVDISALTAGSSLVSLATGNNHTCGLASDGKAYCWGRDNFGQLGENADGDNADENIPVLVDTSALTAGSSFVSLTAGAGSGHTCGLASDGKAYCWGWDGNGQLGDSADGDNADENIPVLVDTSAL